MKIFNDKWLNNTNYAKMATSVIFEKYDLLLQRQVDYFLENLAEFDYLSYTAVEPESRMVLRHSRTDKGPLLSRVIQSAELPIPVLESAKKAKNRVIVMGYLSSGRAILGKCMEAHVLLYPESAFSLDLIEIPTHKSRQYNTLIPIVDEYKARHIKALQIIEDVLSLYLF